MKKQYVMAKTNVPQLMLSKNAHLGTRDAGLPVPSSANVVYSSYPVGSRIASGENAPKFVTLAPPPLPFSASFVFRNPSILLPPFRILGMMCWGTAPPRREEEADQRQQQRSQPCMPTSQEQRRVRHGLGRRKPEGMCRSSWVIQLVCVRSVCVPCCLKFMWGLPMRLNESSPSSR